MLHEQLHIDLQSLKKALSFSVVFQQLYALGKAAFKGVDDFVR